MGCRLDSCVAHIKWCSSSQCEIFSCFIFTQLSGKVVWDTAAKLVSEHFGALYMVYEKENVIIQKQGIKIKYFNRNILAKMQTVELWIKKTFTCIGDNTFKKIISKNF